MRICMLSQSQPSVNPRLVKEADALTEAGHEVTVLGCRIVAWAEVADRELLAARNWKCTFVNDKNRDSGPRRHWTRVRHRLSKALAGAGGAAWMAAALSPSAPELASAAATTPADLYIARHPAALSAAAAAAAKYGARLGYDAEDFEPGQASIENTATQQDRLAEALERRCLPRCDYITAGSPAIADEYARRYGMQRPAPILNVFPISEQPREFRPTAAGLLRLYWFSQTIGPDRGLQDVVKAMGLLKQCRIELHLRGRWAAGFENQLRALAAACGLRTEQIVGHEPGAPWEMARLAADYDIGLALEQNVNRNRDLCLTNKIFTYLLAGCAVVATTTSGQSPILRQVGAAAAAVAPGDVAALAQAFAQWHDDRHGLQRARECSWWWGRQRFNWDREKHVFLNVVHRALAQRAHAAGR